MKTKNKRFGFISKFLNMTSLVVLMSLSLVVVTSMNVSFAANDDGGDKKVNICHSTSSDSNPYEMINISTSAFDAHKEHGDFLYQGPAEATKAEQDAWCLDNAYEVLPDPSYSDVEVCKVNDEQSPLSGWTVKLGNSQAVTDEDGCVTFNDVPFGSYMVDEVMQGGWSNVSGITQVTVDSANEKFTIVNKQDSVDQKATIHAVKIVCDSESDLPNWGAYGKEITADSVQEFLQTAGNNCEIVPWNFQWIEGDVPNPGDNSTNPAGNWMSFSNSAEIPVGQAVSVREQIDTDYISFSGDPLVDVSAEFYCGAEGDESYDNLELLDPVVAGQTYHCVGFNTLKDVTPTTSDVELCKVNNDQSPLSNWTLQLNKYPSQDTGNYSGVTGQNGCVTFNDVPYGSYKVHEIMKSGWKNVSGLTQVTVDNPTEKFTVVNKLSDSSTCVSCVELCKVDSNQNPLPDWTLQLNKYPSQNTGNYSGVTGQNGCVTFNKVPFGTYKIDEVMKDGWSNVSGLVQVAIDSDSEKFTIVNKQISNPNQCDPNQNLIQNGGFENPAVITSNVIRESNPNLFNQLKWKVGWVNEDYSSGRLGLELQRNIVGAPYTGYQHAELDGDNPVKIWQDIPTIPGKTYELNFAYSPRQKVSAEDNEITVKVNGEILGPVLAADGSANTNTDWTMNTRTFVATDNTTRIEFVDTGTPTSKGGYLDEVSLKCQPTTPPVMQCNDGIDNDGDGLMDFPADPGCSSATDNDETNAPQGDIGSIQITKYACPTGTVVTRAANGVGGTVPAGCTPQANATFGYAYGTATNANAPYPELTAPVTAGGSTNGSGVLTISNLSATGRYFLSETNSSNERLANNQILGLYCNDPVNTSATNDNSELMFIGANETVNCVSYNPSVTPPPMQCNDGIDNDGDGQTDFPMDLGCTSASDNDETNLMQCNDGIDNDFDGQTDFPQDPGCTSATDNSEANSIVMQCNDGIDNDGDGLIDFPLDPGCSGGTDNDETNVVNGTASIQILKYSCPTGTVVTRAANGVNGAVPQGCVLQNNATFGYVQGTATNSSAPYPELTAPVTAGGQTSGGSLTISNLTATGRYFLFETNSSNERLANNQLLGLYCNDPVNTSTTNDNSEMIFLSENETVNCVAYNPSTPTQSVGSIQITKYACPTGTVVTRAANGVGGTVPAGCTPQANATFGYAYGTATNANAPYPELTAPVTAGGSTNGSGVLTISNLSATGRYFLSETNSSNERLANNQILGLYCNDPVNTSATNDNSELMFIGANETVNCVSYNPSVTPPPMQCNDGIDNDGDGQTDFPADPGCTSGTDNDETNVVPGETASIIITKYACPTGTVVTRAANGVDGTVPAGCVPQDSATFGYVHGTATNANAPYPELTAPITSTGSSTNLNGMLLITNLEPTGRYFLSETNSSNERLANNQILGLYCNDPVNTSATNDNSEMLFLGANETIDCVAYNPAPAQTLSASLVMDTGALISDTNKSADTTTEKKTSSKTIGTYLGGLYNFGQNNNKVLAYSESSNTCNPYLTKYLKLGSKDKDEVIKLQSFLNENLGLSLKTDGVYGKGTYNAVKAFQEKYAEETLEPWSGLKDKKEGTGYVYKTTQRWINSLKCPTENFPMPALSS